MALINFDCPECGHNLEVDEGGAGFIIKCPECANPLQIPGLPRSRRLRKVATAATTLLALVVLAGSNVYFWSRARALQEEVTDLRPLGEALRQAQALSLRQASEMEHLQQAQAVVSLPENRSLADAALAAIAEAETLAAALEDTSREFLKESASERNRVLRSHMIKLVEAAKNGLPAAPVITDVGPGRGLGGKQIAFPVLPGPDGQVLRENAEVTGLEADKVSFKFPGGTATYALSELHPGVAGFLPGVDPLLVLQPRQRPGEVIRVHQMLSAQREERLQQLRHAIEAALAPESP